MMDRIWVVIWRHWKAIGLWSAWLLLSLLVFVYAVVPLVLETEGMARFSPGPVSDTHAPFGDACAVCHEPFSGEGATAACEDCHSELSESDAYLHTAAVFDDAGGENGAREATAIVCQDCHGEHLGTGLKDMLLSVSPDFCMGCHEDIGEKDEAHRGLDAASCGDCHSYHDNRVYSADFVRAHPGGRKFKDPARVLPRDLLSRYRLQSRYAVRELSRADADAPDAQTDESIVDAWAASRHAASGVNCSFCHGDNGNWAETPDQESCRECHGDETAGFEHSRHGMTLLANRAPIEVGSSSLAMKSDAHSRTTECFACHDPHGDLEPASAVDTCLECHDDDHSLAYKESSHYTAWQEELKGELAPGEGVTCATCHLPREELHLEGDVHVLVQHNASRDLRPRTKMVRTVCLQCHSYRFSMQAMGDPKVIDSNFRESPERTEVPVIDFVERQGPDGR